jgi:hypothetical protein
MTTAPYPSDRQSWERPSLVRLAAGAGSDKITVVPTENTTYGLGS